MALVCPSCRESNRGGATRERCVIAWALAVSLSTAGCGAASGLDLHAARDGSRLDGGRSTDAGIDARTDAGIDAGTDARTDSGTDAGTDARTDSGTDGGTDGGRDTGVDGGHDVGRDAWSLSDAGCTGHLAFGEPTTLPAGCSIASTAIGDVDRDGRPDIVLSDVDTSTGRPRIGVLFNLGARRFTSATSHFDWTTSLSLTVVDLNRDGALDTVSAVFSRTSVHVHLGTGHGDFVPPVEYLAGNGSVTAARTLAVGDLDGDGDLDVAVAELEQNASVSTGGVVGVMFNDGAGVLGPHTTYALPGTPGDMGGAFYRGPLAIAIDDVDGDGTRDIVVATSDANVAVLLNRGDGTFGPPLETSIGARGPSGTTSALALGDLDGDGRADVVATNPAGTWLGTLHSAGAGVLDPEVALIAGPRPGGGVAVVVTDLDANGRNDVITLDGAFLSIGPSTFDTPLTFPSAPPSGTIAVADLDGDGWQDVVFGDPTSCTAFVYFADCH